MDEQKTSFQHILVTWTVKNFCFSRNRAYCIRSAPFYFPNSSSFYLFLEWNPLFQQTQDRLVRIHLIRRKGQNCFRASIRFGYGINLEHKQCYSKTHNCFLESELSEDLILKRGLATSPLLIVCQLFIYDDRPSNSHLLSLRKMPVYWKGSTFTKNDFDYTIALPGCNLPANKSILCLRSTVLKEKIQNTPGNTVHYDLPDEIAFEQFLFYLHLNHLDFHPHSYLSFNIHPLSTIFKVEELTQLTQPKVFELCSEAVGAESSFVWKVKNISLMNPTKYLQSPDLSMNFKMACCLKLIQNEQAFGIFVEMLNEPPDSEVDIAISVQISQQIIYTRAFSFPSTSGKFCGTERFILKGKDYQKKLLPEDTLILRIHISQSDMKFISTFDKVTETLESSHVVPKSLPNENAYDLILESKEKKFPVHRKVLQMRFKKFEPDVLNNLELKPEYIQLLIEFIYTGKLHVEDLKTAIDIYEYAKVLKVHFLFEMCSYYLKVIINNSNAATIFELAKQYDDVNLAICALDHMCKNAHIIMTSGTSPFIRKELAEALTNSYLQLYEEEQMQR